MRIEDMLVRDIKYDKRPRGRNKPDLQQMRAEERGEYESKIETYKREDYRFEKRVFVYLFENRNELGIKNIYVLRNMRVDGLLKLDNEKIIVLEIKYALNWQTCSNARVEVQTFIEDTGIQEEFHKHIPKKQPEATLIIFEHFSGDWKRRTINPKRENGWNLFYEEEEIIRKKLPTIPIDIAQLTEEGLKGHLSVRA